MVQYWLPCKRGSKMPLTRRFCCPFFVGHSFKFVITITAKISLFSIIALHWELMVITVDQFVLLAFILPSYQCMPRTWVSYPNQGSGNADHHFPMVVPQKDTAQFPTQHMSWSASDIKWSYINTWLRLQKYTRAQCSFSVRDDLTNRLRVFRNVAHYTEDT